MKEDILVSEAYKHLASLARFPHGETTEHTKREIDIGYEIHRLRVIVDELAAYLKDPQY